MSDAAMRVLLLLCVGVGVCLRDDLSATALRAVPGALYPPTTPLRWGSAHHVPHNAVRNALACLAAGAMGDVRVELRVDGCDDHGDMCPDVAWRAPGGQWTYLDVTIAGPRLQALESTGTEDAGDMGTAGARMAVHQQ